MAGSRELKVVILGDATSARKALGQVDDATAKSETRWQKYGSAIKAAGLVAGVALLKVGKDSVDAFNESVKVGAQTEAVLKSTGGAANVTAKQIGDLASELQGLSGVEDEAIQQGQNMLLTFTNLKNEAGAGNDIFNQATRTLLDMSVALGTDAKTSAVQLGKALNDPIAGISALSRVGVTFTDEQKATIRTMVEMGDTAGAQKVILAELNKEFGGSAKAAGDAQTPMERLSLRFGDLQEKIGAFLVPALERLIGGLASVIDFVSRLDPKVLIIIGALAGLAAVFVAVNAALGVATAAAAAFGITLNLALLPVTAIVLGLAALTAGLVLAYKNSETFRNIVQAAFGAVKVYVQGVVDAVQLLISAFRTAVDLASKVASAVSKIPNVKNIIPGPLGDVLRAVPGFAEGGTVPGPRGAPMLAVVHGGEQVISNRQQAAGGGATYVVNNYGTLVGSGGMEELAGILREQDRRYGQRNGS